MDYLLILLILILIIYNPLLITSSINNQNQQQNHQNDQSNVAVVYQPTKQEIERFQLIQEQIRQHQQQEQREREERRKIQQQEMDRIRLENQLQIQSRHYYPAESLLIPQTALIPMFMNNKQQQQQQHIYSDHRVPMPPQPSNSYGHNLPLIPPPTTTNYQMQMINNHGDNNNFNKQYSRMSNNFNNQHQQQQQHYDFDNKIDKLTSHVTDPEESDSSRFDKSRPLTHSESIRDGGHHRYRCYSCQWNIAHCSDFNCYNNPDICTTNNFAPHRVQQADCPGGCEQFVITDPNGLTQQWKRGCAQPGSFPIIRMRCHTYYEFGVRIDRCVCNNDWCNKAITLSSSSSSIVLLLLSLILINLIFCI